MAPVQFSMFYKKNKSPSELPSKKWGQSIDHDT